MPIVSEELEKGESRCLTFRIITEEDLTPTLSMGAMIMSVAHLYPANHDIEICISESHEGFSIIAST